MLNSLAFTGAIYILAEASSQELPTVFASTSKEKQRGVSRSQMSHRRPKFVDCVSGRTDLSGGPMVTT
jgi:hypothetical protein